jgi:hypothetical protein
MVYRDRECLRQSTGSAYSSNRCIRQKFKQSGSFAVMFPKLKRNLERSLKPDDLKEFLSYFCNPASPEHCLVDRKLYCDLDSTSQILDSLHSNKYINPANMLLLQEIVDRLGSEESQALLCDYNSSNGCSIFVTSLSLLVATFIFIYCLNFSLPFLSTCT